MISERTEILQSHSIAAFHALGTLLYVLRLRLRKGTGHKVETSLHDYVFQILEDLCCLNCVILVEIS